MRIAYLSGAPAGPVRPSLPRPRSLAGPVRVLAAAALVGAAAAAQGGPRLYVSTTSDVAPSGAFPGIDDGGLVAAGGGAPPVPGFEANHWLAQAGFAPSDVDGFARILTSPPGAMRSYVFTMLSDQGGFLDGDVLTFVPGGGLSVLVSEDVILAGLGIAGGNVDVDACDLDDQGRLLFSLQTDEPGTLLGDLQDGDVLRVEFDGSVTLVATEQQVQNSFSVATGLADSINDVQGIEWEAGELWVAIQSPSPYDGGVLAVGPAARIVVDEAELGLGGAEIDALSTLRPEEELAVLRASVSGAAPGETVRFDVQGPPNEVFLVVMSGAAGYVPFPGFDGWGGFYVDWADPWLNATLSMPAESIVVLDGSGRYSVDYALPSAPVFGPGLDGTDGWTLQLLSASGQVAAPIRIEKL